MKVHLNKDKEQEKEKQQQSDQKWKKKNPGEIERTMKSKQMKAETCAKLWFRSKR